MTVTKTQGYTLAEAIKFARTIRQNSGSVFECEGIKALRMLAVAKDRRRFDRVIDVVVASSPFEDTLARLEYRCMVADHGFLGHEGKTWNEMTALPELGPTQAYFQKRYGTPYEDMRRAKFPQTCRS